MIFLCLDSGICYRKFVEIILLLALPEPILINQIWSDVWTIGCAGLMLDNAFSQRPPLHIGGQWPGLACRSRNNNEATNEIGRAHV